MPYTSNKIWVGDIEVKSPGELNQIISSLIDEYIKYHTITYGRELTYVMLNDILGALEGAKLEFYRRIVVPYENLQCSRNGDVYVNALRALEDKGANVSRNL